VGGVQKKVVQVVHTKEKKVIIRSYHPGLKRTKTIRGHIEGKSDPRRWFKLPSKPQHLGEVRTVAGSSREKKKGGRESLGKVRDKIKKVYHQIKWECGWGRRPISGRGEKKPKALVQTRAAYVSYVIPWGRSVYNP